MNMDDLIGMIYEISDRTPVCAHCHRPLVIVSEDGRQFLYCKHCADLEAEEQRNSVILNCLARRSTLFLRAQFR